MKIRKLTFSIGYMHILDFHQEYKKVIGPFFGIENLNYSIENQSTVEEGIQLIFEKEGFMIICRKNGISFIYEGDIGIIMNSHTSIIKLFFDIYEKISQMKSLHKKINCSLNVHIVDIVKKNYLYILNNPKQNLIFKYPIL